MPMPYFSWNGVRNDLMGLVLRQYPNPVMPKERMNEVTIPGRSGVLTVLEDYDTPVFDAYSMTLSCYVDANANLREIFKWLRGPGKLILYNDPDYIIDARVTSEVTASQILPGYNDKQMDIQVRCQPFKKQRMPDAIEYTVKAEASTTRLWNPGQAAAYPEIVIPVGSQMTECIIQFGTENNPEHRSDNGTLTIKDKENMTLNEFGLRYDVETGLCFDYNKTRLMTGVMIETPGQTETASGTIIKKTRPLLPMETNWITISGVFNTHDAADVSKRILYMYPTWRYL